MTWGIGLITGRTRYAVLLIPALFMVHPIWVLFQIAAYGRGVWCRPHQASCFTISVANNPALIRVEIGGSVFTLLVSLALIVAVLFVIRRADRLKITESAYSPQMRLLLLAAAVLIFAVQAFHH